MNKLVQCFLPVWVEKVKTNCHHGKKTQKAKPLTPPFPVVLTTMQGKPLEKNTKLLSAKENQKGQ